MLKAIKRFPIFFGVSCLFLASLSFEAHARSFSTLAQRAIALREVFGDSVVDGLSALPLYRFKGAKEIAMDLAEKVKADALDVNGARDQLLAILVKMEHGEPVAFSSYQEVEVVGVLPKGDSVVAHEAPAETTSTVAQASEPASEKASAAEGEPIPGLEPDSPASNNPERQVSSVGG